MLSRIVRIAVFLGWLRVSWSYEPNGPEDLSPYPITGIPSSSNRSSRLLKAPPVAQQQRLSESPTPMALEQLVTFLFSTSPPYQTYIIFDNTYPELTTLLKMLATKFEQITLIQLLPDVQTLYPILTAPLSITGTARRNIVTLCSADNVASVFETVAVKNMENSNFWWVVVSLMENEDRKKSHLQDYVREGSQVTFVQISSGMVFTLQSSRFDEKGGMRFQDICVWTPERNACQGHARSSIAPSLNVLYSNFHGRQLIASAQEDSPFFTIKKGKSGVEGVSGVDFTILQVLGDSLNFTHKLVLPPDGKWGGPADDGKVVGMIGLVSRREADIAICEMSRNAQRESVTDFTYPYFVEPVTIVSNAPRERRRILAAFSPFALPVWLCIVAATIFMGPVLKAETAFMRSYLREAPEMESGAGNFSFNMFRSLICQANLISSDHWAHRLTFYSWYLFSFLVFVEYSGILTASLITPSFEKPIDSLVDLPRAVAAGATIGLIEDSSFDQLFRESRGNVYAQTYALLNHKDRSRSFLKYAEEGFDRIMVEEYIVINGLSGSRTRAAQRGQRRFHFGRETFAPQYYGISCFRGAPFIPKFDQLLSRMVASGLITKWLEDEIRKHRENQVVDGDAGPKAISLRHLQAAFYIIPMGYFLATLAFSYEVLVSPKKRKGIQSNSFSNSHSGGAN